MTALEVIGQLLAVLLIVIASLGVVAVYIYLRTLDGLLTGDGWLARFLRAA